jgi:hypothetical protein
MSNNTHQFTTSIHDGEVFLTYKGAAVVDAGILFPSPAFSMWHINALVATLNTYFPTEPAQRFCESTKPAAPTPGDTEKDKFAEFGRLCLQSAKEAIADGSMGEEDEETMELAQRLGVGNVRRVIYDPALHGDVDEAEPGSEIWYWGAAALQRPARDGGGR